MATGISEEATYIPAGYETVLVFCFNIQKGSFGCSWWKGGHEIPGTGTKMVLREN